MGKGNLVQKKFYIRKQKIYISIIFIHHKLLFEQI